MHNSNKVLYALFGLALFKVQDVFSAPDTKVAPQTIEKRVLKDFSFNPPNIQRVIEMGLDLAGRNLGYKYGSANPSAQGMDCSGTMYYLLTQLGILSVPRSSDGQYQWVKEKGKFYPANTSDIQSDTFSNLKPGNLLFWSGTYQTPDNVQASHVMMYIGKNSQGERLMVGASDGRTYQGRQIFGVSVFDFKLPSPNSKSKFLGYSCIPNFSCDAS
ncbi:MAG: C40 family peptidase [Legionella sp.]|nr:C40 family peptidase [Legionella sp.]